MKTVLTVIAWFFMMSSCITAEKGFVSSSLNMQWGFEQLLSDSHGRSLIVIGVSNRRMSRRGEIDAAKNDAARKVAMFHRMWGTVESAQRAGVPFFDFNFDSKINFEPVDYEQFVERLEFDPDRDVRIMESGTLVRFSYPIEVMPVRVASTADRDGRPDWTRGRNLPSVDGYITGVGFSLNQRWFSDTVMNSFMGAAARILEQAGVTVMYEIDDSGQGSAITHIQTKSEGFLDGFRVLAIWVEPETGNVFTLGIAKRVQ